MVLLLHQATSYVVGINCQCLHASSLTPHTLRGVTATARLGLLCLHTALLLCLHTFCLYWTYTFHVMSKHAFCTNKYHGKCAPTHFMLCLNMLFF